MWKRLFFTILLFTAPVTVARGAIIVVSDVGDRDGFNGVYNPDFQTMPVRFLFSTVPANGAGEAAFTDQQSFFETAPSVVNYTHGFTLPAGFIISSIDFEIVTFDNASVAQGYAADANGRIFIDGVEVRRGANQDFFFDSVGELFGGAADNFNDGGAERFTASLPASRFPDFLDGQVIVEYRGSGANMSDEVAVDYSRLVITGDIIAVPEPGTATMLLFLGSIAVAARRWQRSRLRKHILSSPASGSDTA